eukprot:5877744-Karenia_brevis.AAC.1
MFGDGTKVPTADEATYLGVKLNSKCNVSTEIAQRKSACIAVWKKLETFWKHADVSKKFQLQ